jgi:hypothetical protein
MNYSVLFCQIIRNIRKDIASFDCSQVCLLLLMIVQSSGTSCLGSHVYSIGTKYLPLHLTSKSVSATGAEHRSIDTGECLNTRRETCPSVTLSATNAT